MQTPDSDHRWFLENVHAHDRALRSYLRRIFPALGDVDDVVQDAYSKVIKARKTGAIEYPKALLFRVARNLALDLFRRRQVISFEPIPETGRSLVIDEGANPAERLSHDQELQLLAAAIEALPKRCRQVLKLRKIYGQSHEEIAAQLGISKATVATQIHLGVQRCAEYLAARGVRPGLNDAGSP